MDAWRAVLRCLRSLWRRLRGLLQQLHQHQHHQHPAGDGDVEQQQLLSPGPRSSSSQGLAPAVDAQQAVATTIIVMRHGHRQDEEDSSWQLSAARAWDPPLSAKGKQQALDAAAKLAGHRIDAVVASPFKRCLQTSAGVVRGLPGFSEDGNHSSSRQWLVDWAVAEVCEPRVLFGMLAEAHVAAAAGSNVEAWMWGPSTDTEAALAKFVREEGRNRALPLPPVPRRQGAAGPHYPEDLDQGLARYAAAFQELAASFAGRTVLVVTHGECVRQAVLMAQPGSEVFEVTHTGFVVLQHTSSSSSSGAHQHQQGSQHHARRSRRAAGEWRLLSGAGETGVLWLEDDSD